PRRADRIVRAGWALADDARVRVAPADGHPDDDLAAPQPGGARPGARETALRLRRVPPVSATLGVVTDERPDPEALLARVKEEEARARRGKLKVFFGAAAGVGKTYAMLEAACEAKADGKEIVVGYVETHGRAETDALLEGLEAVQPLRVPYHGALL